MIAISSVSSNLRLSYCEMANLTEDAAVTLQSANMKNGNRDCCGSFEACLSVSWAYGFQVTETSPATFGLIIYNNYFSARKVINASI